MRIVFMLALSYIYVKSDVSSLPVYSLLMLGGQELLMATPGSGSAWFPYTSRGLPDTGSYRVEKAIVHIKLYCNKRKTCLVLYMNQIQKYGQQQQQQCDENIFFIYLCVVFWQITVLFIWSPGSISPRMSSL